MSLKANYVSFFFSRSDKGYVKGGTHSRRHASVSGTKVHGLRPLSLKIGLRHLPVCFSVWSMQHAIISHCEVIAPSPPLCKKRWLRDVCILFLFGFVQGDIYHAKH